MLFFAAVMINLPEFGYGLVMLLLSVSLLLYGARYLVYYFTMARFMVGGKASLYLGIILFDLGMFSMTLTTIPKTYVIMYLAGANLIAGGIDILSAVDAKKTGSPSWRMKLAGGVVCVAAAVTCVLCGDNQKMMVYIYCFGLVNSAVFKIISAFRKTAIVYIQ